MIAGTVLVVAAGAVGLGITSAALSEVNTENTNLAARLTAIENSRYSFPSSISSDIAANCAAVKAIAGVTAAQTDMWVDIKTTGELVIAAAAANPC